MQPLLLKSAVLDGSFGATINLWIPTAGSFLLTSDFFVYSCVGRLLMYSWSVCDYNWSCRGYKRSSLLTVEKYV